MPDLKGLYHELVRFETELWSAADTRLRRECDLQLTWFEVLQSLGRRPRQRVQDLATEFVITVGGTSKVVDRIEQAGLLRRVANPDDRRSSLLELTRHGKQKLADATPVFEDELALRFGALAGGTELDRLAASLRLLRTTAFAPSDRLTA
ncbi:MarR family winged helix-turn-helix transcriptional regulator [Leucobacter sp. wl10]|uniref:MarR family winged helix-turn-helix transcriptional regulator n=1 Tax=Leucobacter sp. wl10 TaxID=2304677 RepID=UPI000E5AAF8A|nr:MarR family transcriptional regulator [Leucobacter sp. wl10]RGE19601.1 MarR family transcriptional regulator [Leucobacter sp. wl10]